MIQQRIPTIQSQNHWQAKALQQSELNLSSLINGWIPASGMPCMSLSANENAEKSDVLKLGRTDCEDKSIPPGSDDSQSIHFMASPSPPHIHCYKCLYCLISDKICKRRSES